MLQTIKQIAAENIVDAIFGRRQGQSGGGQKGNGGLLDTIVGAVTDIFTGRRKQSGGTGSGLFEGATASGESGGFGGFGDFGAQFKEGFAGFFSGLKDAFSNVLGGFKDFFGGFFSNLKGVFTSIGSGLVNAITGIVKFITGLFGFASGGYTGEGGKHEPAGIVHKGEFVIPADIVDRIGVPALYKLIRGYAEGGLVGSGQLIQAALSGGASGITALAGQGGSDVNLKQIFLFDGDRMVENFLAPPRGEQLLVSIVGRNGRAVEQSAVAGHMGYTSGKIGESVNSQSIVEHFRNFTNSHNLL